METWNPNLYEDAIAGLAIHRKTIIDDFKGKLKWAEGEDMLDIGCGPGDATAKLLLPLLPKSGKLVGADQSAEMIKHAKNRFGNNRLEFLVTDIIGNNITESLGSERFHKVFSFFALNWVNDQRKCVENIKKIMKPNGVALITIISDSGIFHIYKAISKDPKWRKYMLNINNAMPPFHPFSNAAQVYTELLECVGFKVFECTVRPGHFDEPTIESLIKAMMSINPFLSEIPEKLHAEFMDDYVKYGTGLGWIKKLQFGNETKYILPFDLMVAHFQKPQNIRKSSHHHP